jgi:multiple sugar transport system substrate-binding protein
MGMNKASYWNSRPNLIDFSRRDFLKASAAVAGATLAAPAVHAQSGVTLRFLTAETATATQAVLKRAIDEYESKFGVKVIIDSSPISGSLQKVIAAIRSGASYDFATMGFVSSLLQLVEAGVLMPVTDLVKKHEWAGDSAWQYQGETWYYPYDINLVANFYRKDLYADKGLKVPETWDQFIENCRALTGPSSRNTDVNGCVIPLASDSATNWASFGNLFAERPQFYDNEWNVVLDQGENADRTARFLDFYAEAYKTMPGGMNAVSYAQLMALFATGTVAHSVYSGRLVEALERTNPELASQYGIFASPDSSGEQKAVSYANAGFVIFKTPRSEETRKFLEWIVNGDYYIDWMLAAPINSQPARMDVYENERWRSHPMIQKHWDTMMEMKSYIEDDRVRLEAVDSIGPSVDMRPALVFANNILPEMLQNKVLREMSSVDCVATAAEQMRALG